MATRCFRLKARGLKGLAGLGVLGIYGFGAFERIFTHIQHLLCIDQRVALPTASEEATEEQRHANAHAQPWLNMSATDTTGSRKPELLR